MAHLVDRLGRRGLSAETRGRCSRVARRLVVGQRTKPPAGKQLLAAAQVSKTSSRLERPARCGAQRARVLGDNKGRGDTSCTFGRRSVEVRRRHARAGAAAVR